MSRTLLLSLTCASALAAGAPSLAQTYAAPTYAPPTYAPQAYAPDGGGTPVMGSAVSLTRTADPLNVRDQTGEESATPDDPQSTGRSPPPADPSAPPAAARPVAPLAAAPTASAVAAAEDHDPWEGTNRRLYDFNRGLDRVVLRPGVVFYHHATPTPVRHGISNALSNLNGPIIFINDVLQLRPSNAARTLGRFVLNSVVGFGGFVDVASQAGIAYHNADFGETMGRYGVPSGPYIFLPVLGPSTLRDASGRIVDGFADPFNSINYGGARDVLAPTRLVVGGINARDQVDPLLKEIDRTATDPYVTTRSLYLQNRRALVRGGATDVQSVQALPDFAPAPAPYTPRPRTPPSPAPVS